MTRSLFTPILWVFLSQPIHAGSVEFSQWIPWKFISQELRKNELFLDVTKTEVQLSLGELRPVLSGVTFSTQAKIQNFAFINGAISLAGMGSISVQLEAFKINQVISRELGGNIIQLQLKAECSPTSIEVNSFGLQSLFQVNQSGSFLPELTALSLEILPDDWKVSAIRCEGLGGIGEEIQDAINKAMKDPAAISALLTQWMKPHLDTWIKEKWLAVSNSQGQWDNLRIVSPGEKGFYLQGELPLQGAEEIVMDTTLPLNPDLESPRFYISREGWLALAEDKLRSLLPKNYDLRQNESFRKLQQSRFMQMLIWPHLRKFHSTTPFVMKTDPSSLNLTMSESRGQWKADLKGNGSLTTVVGGSPIDYIVFGLKLSCPISMNVEGGNLILRSGKAIASLDWKLGYLYQLLYSPDKKIPVQIMSGALAGLVSDKLEIMKLPEFQIADSVYILGNLKIEDQLLTMDWL